jgi:hypothetical protein
MVGANNYLPVLVIWQGRDGVHPRLYGMYPVCTVIWQGRDAKFCVCTVILQVNRVILRVGVVILQVGVVILRVVAVILQVVAVILHVVAVTKRGAGVLLYIIYNF